MDEKNSNAAASTAQSINHAIKMGKDTARAAKTITKIASQLAAGNVAGAAISAIKDPETIKKVAKVVLVPILAFVLIIVCLLYALPTVIYEAAESYYSELKEQWEQDVYGSSRGVLWAAMQANQNILEKVVTDYVKSVWTNLTSLFTREDGDVDDGSESLSENGIELMAAQYESAAKETLNRKIDACINKLNTRSKEIEKAILHRSGDINKYFKDKFAGLYDEWGGTTITIFTNDITRTEAIKLLSAYTVMTGADIRDMKLSDFMRWLGYRNELDFTKTSFNVGGQAEGITCDVNAWRGGFMPQYLMEQKKYEVEHFGTTVTDFTQYMCPAVDMLLVVYSPDFSTVSPVITYETRVVYSLDIETGEITSREVQVSIATVNIQIMIYTRDVDSFSDLIGFWDGPLPANNSAPVIK